MSLDPFNPAISVVSKGVEGKVITIYGSNSLGKTKQTTKFPKPYYLGFEKGLNAIAGIPFAPITNWSEFIKVNNKLTSKKTLEKAKEMYQTIIFDEVDTAARYCTKYVIDKHNADSIASGNGGFGLWKEYETAFWEEIDKLISSGFTVIFIAHEVIDKEGKAYPKGDKRSISPVIDNSDVVVYVSSNGTNEKGRVIKSSGYMAETSKWFARSRFDYIDPYLPTFTAQALEDAIIEAIEQQEEEEGIVAVSFNQQKETNQGEELDFDELKEQIKKLAGRLYDLEKGDEALEIVENRLGKGKEFKDFNKNHVEIMAVVLDEMQELILEIENDDNEEDEDENEE